VEIQMFHHNGVTNYTVSTAVSIRAGHKKEMASIFQDELNYEK
jgi:hypothetical protein